MAKSRPTEPPISTGLTPASAVDRLDELYRSATDALETALDSYLANRRPPTARQRSAFRYPLLRIVHRDHARPRTPSMRAFAKLQRAGIYETTVTHPAEFRGYLIEQLTPLVAEYGAQIEVTASGQEIPYPYVLERAEEVAKAGVSAQELARHFPTPNLAAAGDEVPGAPFPLALFDAARTDYSLRRLVHYTGSDWRHVQRWVLLTNYHRYIDQFVRIARDQLRKPGPYDALVLPGNVTIPRELPEGEADARLLTSHWHR